jgi:serine/threonine protein kinase
MVLADTLETENEIELLKNVKNKSPFILEYFEDFSFKGVFRCIITEYCSNGDLDHWIAKYKSKGKHFELDKINFWFFQLSNGLAFLHKLNIIHRDMKPKYNISEA